MTSTHWIALILGVVLIGAGTSVVNLSINRQNEQKLQALRLELSKEETKRWQLFLEASSGKQIPQGQPTEMTFDEFKAPVDEQKD